MKTGPPARPRTLALALAAGALLLVLAFGAWAFNPGPRWRVAPTQQADGNVLFDGDPVPATDTEAMNDVLVAGAVLEWRGFGDLELLSPGHALLVVAPGTALTLPAPPPRWFGRTSRARLAEGTLRFLPGPRFKGARLVVETPDRAIVTRGGAIEVSHDPAAGTRVDSTGAALQELVRTRFGPESTRP